MLTGKVIYLSADATEPANQRANSTDLSNEEESAAVPMHKVRIAFDSQTLISPHGNTLPLTPGMQTVAEIH